LASSESHLSLRSTYEVVGKVITLDGGMGLGLRVLGATEWPKNPDTGTAIDLKAYEAVVDATHRYKGIFYENESSGGVGGYDGAGDTGEGTMY
jgi:replication factor A3